MFAVEQVFQSDTNQYRHNQGDAMNNYLDSTFEPAFQLLRKEAGLTWSPWVGKEYSRAREKVLIVGESHYTNNPDPDGAKKDINQYLQNAAFTQEVVFEAPICRYWSTPFFDNLHRALFCTSKVDGGKLWSEVAFYNFVQRQMEYRYRERPQWVDYYKAWATFISVVKVLEPKTCLFVGVEAANSFNLAMQELGVDFKGVIWGGKICRTYSRTASVTINDKVIKLIFIQHSSQMFSWSQWHEYLDVAMSSELRYLSAKVNGQALAVKSLPEDISVSDVDGQNICRTRGMPTHLGHKPIIAVNYSDVTDDDSGDAKFLSIGHAQYNRDCASVKVWRHTGKRWSRQSEEVPIERLCDMALLLCNTIKLIQCDGVLKQTTLKEEVVDEAGIEFLKHEIEENKTRITQSAKELKEVLNEIDFDKM